VSVDANTLVEMSIEGQFYELQRILADEVGKYRQVTSSSPLVLAISEAYAQLCAMPDQGPFDDLHPRWVLFRACPHPLTDGMGYCGACGADLSDG